jgi:preprotein translocase subunit SecA
MSYEHQSLAGADAILAAGGTSTAAAAGFGGAVATGDLAAPKPKVNSPMESVGRNDPCWCGSGKKYKKCHGA